MKVSKITFLFFCTIFTIAGCLDNTTEPEPIIEVTGKSNYYIINQSGSNLDVTYKMAGIDKDSTVAVFADSTTKIFESATIGGYPFPSSAFDDLRFYEKADDESVLLLTIEPVVNENWNRTVEANKAAKFKLVITKKDLQ